MTTPVPRQDRPSPLWRLWNATASRHLRATAVIDLPAGTRWNFERVRGRALGWAFTHRRLVNRAAAFALPNSTEWFEIFLGLQFLGATAIPIDPATPRDAALAIAQNLGASLLVVPGACLPIASPARRRWPDFACLKLTSGSTGLPKPWPCRAAQLIADGRQVARTMGVRPTDRNLALIPLGHSYALGNIVMPLILQGTPAAAAPEFVPAQIPEWIARWRLTVFPTVPSVLQALAASPSIPTLQPLRLAISAGAPLPAETARAFHAKFGLVPHNFYGASESGGVAYDREGADSLRGAAIGSPLAGVRIAITRGRRIAVTSRAVLHPSRRIILPDRAELLPGRRLRLLGRIRPAANIGGRKVDPAEVERALRTLPGVTDAWASAARSGNREYLVAAAESHEPGAALRARLAQKLPAWKLPRILESFPALPRTARGKVDATAVGARFSCGP